ncbi:MAG: hypothetical protein ACRDAU_10610 [Clostridium sp.]
MYRRIKGVALKLLMIVIFFIGLEVVFGVSAFSKEVVETTRDINEMYLALFILVLLVCARGVFAIYQFHRTTNVLKKEREKAKKMLENPSDSSWIYENLISRAKICFRQINNGLQEDSLEIISGYISENFNKNIDKTVREGRLQNVEILKVIPMKAIDEIGDSEDFVVLIIQYKGIQDGYIKTREETWTYVKRYGVWVVDKFDSFDVGMSLEKFENI